MKALNIVGAIRGVSSRGGHWSGMHPKKEWKTGVQGSINGGKLGEEEGDRRRRKCVS